MLVKDFRNQLFRGLGAPLLYLINHVNKPQKKYVRSIISACVQETAYDPQSEMERTQYLYETIKYSGFSSLIQEKVLEYLASSEEEYDIQLMLRLVRRFAEDGNAEAQKAIRQAFRYSQAWNCFIGAEELIALDGRKGLKRVVVEIGRKIVKDDYTEIDLIHNFAIEHFGEDTVHTFFETHSDNIYVSAYLSSIREYKRTKGNDGINRQHVTYDEIRKFIEQKDVNKHRFFLPMWGSRASETELKLAAEDLLKQTEAHAICLYLAIFQKRVFPLSEKLLIYLARSHKSKISDQAILALRNIKSKLVHAFAIELLKADHPHKFALELLVLNYEQQDLPYVQRVLLMKQNKDSFHDRALAAMHIFERHDDPACISLILYIYQNGYCSHCKEGFIDILLANHWLPVALMDELLHDSNLDIREKVKQYHIGKRL